MGGWADGQMGGQLFRHPEGAKRPKDLLGVSLEPPRRQVTPFRITCLDQAQFPLARPAFDLPFSGRGDTRVGEFLEMHQSMDAIASGEASE